MKSQIIAVFNRIKEYTLESIKKSKGNHDGWLNDDFGYDAGWINNELGRAQMFLLVARPELQSQKVHSLDINKGETSLQVLDEIMSKDSNYIDDLIRVFNYFDVSVQNGGIFWSMNDLIDPMKINVVKSIFASAA
jgi:hypothetical protein